MEILLFVFVIAAVALITWGALLHQQNAPLRMPSQIVTTKFKKSGPDLDKILPTR